MSKIQVVKSAATVDYSPELAAFLQRSHRMAIGGNAANAASGGKLEVLDPATDRPIAAVPAGDALDIDSAVSAARSAFRSTWPAVSFAQREEILRAIANGVEAKKSMLEELIALESGKPKEEAHYEVLEAINTTRYNAGWATRIEGISGSSIDGIRDDRTVVAYTRREPVGVVGAIVPWNFPLVNIIDRVIPALAAGCTVVLKPAEDTPLTSLAFAEIAAEAGLPAGVLNVVTGLGATAGAALARHPGINKIAFTGSTATGRAVGAAAINNIVPAELELGGKSPMIILDDVDLERDAFWMNVGAFYNAGQCCTAGSRVFVEQNVLDNVIDTFRTLAGQHKIGHGLAEGTTIGSLVSRRQQKRVNEYLRLGHEQGAQAVVGGQAWAGEGAFVEPTVFLTKDHSIRIVQEEIFGPVITVIPFSDMDELIRLANDTQYGLTASIWSNDAKRINRLIPKLDAGVVWVNAHHLLDRSLPFGGYKRSGIGRENGAEGISTYLQTKSVIGYY